LPPASQHLDGATPKPSSESFTASTPPTRPIVRGIGAGTRAQRAIRKPYDRAFDYLDELDEYAVPANQRVLAAIGREC